MGSLKASLMAAGLVLAGGVALLAPAMDAGGQTTPPPVSALSWTNANAAAGSGSNELKSISCTSANFCVAVGEQNSGAGLGALIEQWNGATWTVTSNPASATHGAELNSVSCVGPNFCIAVGAGTTPFLAERWDGSSWSVSTTGMSVPSGATAPTLYSVSCVSSTVCETLGTYFGQPGNVTTVTAFQWNGTSWTNEAAATPSGSGSPPVTEATGMDCVSPTWCLAVGNVDANRRAPHSRRRGTGRPGSSRPRPHQRPASGATSRPSRARERRTARPWAEPFSARRQTTRTSLRRGTDLPGRSTNPCRTTRPMV